MQPLIGKRMSFNYSPWPHLDVANLPKPVRQFLHFTIGVSLYVGVVLTVVVVAMATADAVVALMQSGLTDFSSFIAEIGSLFIDVALPA